MKTNNTPSRPAIQCSAVSATVRVAGAVIDLVRCPSRTSDNRDKFAYAIVLPDGSEHHGDDLRSGCGGCSLKEAAETLLSFLSACAESVASARRSGREGENADLFPVAVGEWADQNSDEIAMLEIESREGVKA